MSFLMSCAPADLAAQEDFAQERHDVMEAWLIAYKRLIRADFGEHRISDGEAWDRAEAAWDRRALFPVGPVPAPQKAYAEDRKGFSL